MTERREPPNPANGHNISIRIGNDGTKVYLITGEYEDGSLAQVFLKFGKHGTTLEGLLRWLGITISLALQHGVTIGQLASVPIHDLRFEPGGKTDDEEIGYAWSVADAVMRKLVLMYGTQEDILLLCEKPERIV